MSPPRTHGTNPPQHLADTAYAAWVAFVRDGGPGWRPVGHGTGMVFDEECRKTELLTIERRIAAAVPEARG
ncbi:hypothetical protein ABZ805_24145 [Saccharopolyspora sp. NPDC047091]|uniref:hypothetical protein n=1 Tax=Saccharopolyspora sp. NPDC047091 TaxID=3155924 RepID=UPI0033E0B85A